MKGPADRYIEQVRRHVLADRSEVERLEADLRSHFAAAAEGQEAPEDVIRRLGTPEEVAASFMAGVTLHHAGFWVRLAAFLGDLGLGAAVIAPPVLALAALADAAKDRGGEPSILFLAVAVTVLLAVFGLTVFYFPVLEHVFGRTFGKRMLGLRVIAEGGGPIGLGTAFVRRLPIYFDLLWLDALFIPFTEKKQRAFDIVAKTVVVYDPDARGGIAGWLLCLLPWAFLGLLCLGFLLVPMSAG